MANEREAMAGETIAGETIAGETIAAVIDAWGELPQDIQQTLFERAVANGYARDGLREALAKFLHDRHPRTADH